MFHLTKTIYSATICKVMTFFNTQVVCEAVAVNGDINHKSHQIVRRILHVIVPTTCAAVLTVLFGFAMSNTNGIQAEAEEQAAVYQDSSESFKPMEKSSLTQASVEASKIKIIADSGKSFGQVKSTYQEATGLFIDGTFVGSVENREDLTMMLEQLLNNHTPETHTSSSFMEEVEIKTDFFPVSSIISVNELQAKVTDLSLKPMGYTVKEGDTWDTLAEQFGTTSSELKALNPNITSPLESGCQLNLIVKKSMLNVVVIAEESYEQDVDFAIEVQKDDTKYNDFSKVITEGKIGRSAYVDTVIYINGKEVQRSNISTTEIETPITHVVIEGTKIRPDGSVPGESSGILTWPVPTVRVVSSCFGYRWGVHHNGIDIANGNAHGETIVAADAGTVEFAQSDNSGYGLYVIINHGNGRKTLYAHASKLLVKAGDKVAKGQAIALIGNTGDSYGSHLHFEVIENGVKVNPLNYL